MSLQKCFPWLLQIVGHFPTSIFGQARVMLHSGSTLVLSSLEICSISVESYLTNASVNSAQQVFSSGEGRDCFNESCRAEGLTRA